MSPLPDFTSPPLVEVALSVQFEPIEGFSVARVGRLWERFQQRFPKTEDYPPLPTRFEVFGPPTKRRLELQLAQGSTLPRVWFLNAAETEVLQIQLDRFVHNWRKTDSEIPDYPRYESIRSTFSAEYGAFLAFLEESSLGRPEVNQCEITYVNTIPSAGLPGLAVFSESYSDDFLPSLEAAGLNLQYLILDDQQTRGRLHIQASSGLLATGPAMRLTLSARGAPLAPDSEGALQFFDLGRDWIVRGFCSVTSSKMHKAWGRKQ